MAEATRHPGGTVPGIRLAALTLVATVVVALIPAPGYATPQRQTPHPAEKVLLFSLPRITWADIADTDLPHLERLLARSAVAQLSPRTAGSRTTTADGYATIGAGNRADGDAGRTTGGAAGEFAMDRTERIDGRYAYQAYRARVGKSGDGDVLHLGIAEVRASNQAGRYGAVPGALGSALRRDGHTTAVIGNADSEGEFRRSAALAMMGRDGVVAGGTVSADLNTTDPTAPYGFAMDRPAAVRAFDTAWRQHDVTLVEASDIERADTFSTRALPAQARTLRRQALADADQLLGDLLKQVDLRRHLVMVVTPAAPRTAEELGVFAMAGPGVRPGAAVSGTTRRDSYVTLPDIAPTVLDRFGTPVPPVMTGTPIKLGTPRPVTGDLIAEYVRDNQVAVFRDRVTGPVTAVFIGLQVLAYLLAAIILIGGRRTPSPRWRRAARWSLLTVLALPAITFLSGLLPYDRLGPVGYVAALLLAALGLAGCAAWLGRIVGRLVPVATSMLPPLAIIAVTWATLIVDVLFGRGRMQLDTVFGYSPIVAGRFSGYGNFAFSLVAICALIVATGAWAIAMLTRRASAVSGSGTVDAEGTAPRNGTAGATRTTEPEQTAEREGAADRETAAAAGRGDAGSDTAARPGTKPVRSRARLAVGLLGVALILGFTVVVDGYPAYGSDIGGVLAAVPAFALVLLLLAGVAVTWQRLALVGLVTVATIAAFAAVDLTRPVEQRTHLGRMVERMNDTGGVATIIERKLAANLSILTSSIWTWVVPIAVAFLIVLSWRRLNALSQLRREIPGMTACLWGAAVVAILGFALNDSGIAVPAMMSTMLLPYLGYLALGLADRTATASR